MARLARCLGATIRHLAAPGRIRDAALLPRARRDRDRGADLCALLLRLRLFERELLLGALGLEVAAAAFVLGRGRVAIGLMTAQALLELDDNLIMISSGPGGAAAREVGATVAWEGYVDLEYDENGDLMLERSVAPRNADAVAKRTVKLVKDKVMPKIDGGTFDLEVQTICLHGDSPTAVEVAREVRRQLAEADIEVAPLSQHKLATTRK